jgi:NAD dependent epimerase/dehydratase family enzyme
MKTALIIGSTGLIGSQLLKSFRESTAYDKVIAFVKEIRENTHKLTQHIIDFDKPESYQNLVVGDDFSTLVRLSKMQEVKHLEKSILISAAVCRFCFKKMT